MWMMRVLIECLVTLSPCHLVTLSSALGFALGCGIASFCEYAVHRLMHRRVVLGSIHVQHHKDGTADGWVWEALYYLAGAVPAGAAAVALGWWAGVPWLAGGAALGGVAYAVFAGYAHQLQHDRPDLVFWMPMPVHYVHHAHRQWRANFGIGVDVWDRVFGTYQPTACPARRVGRVRDYLRVRRV